MRDAYLRGNIDELENTWVELVADLKVAKASGRAAKRMAVPRSMNKMQRRDRRSVPTSWQNDRLPRMT